MKIFKECAILWSDLSWYCWGGTFTRAIHTCYKLDIYKREHPFIYYITSFIYPFLNGGGPV